MPKKSNVSGEKIEFRWKQADEEWQQRLVDSAAEVRRPINAHARELVKMALLNPQDTQFQIKQIRAEIDELQKAIDSLGEGIEALHENTFQLRDALVTGIAKLLVEAGGMDVERTKHWIKNTLDTE